MNVLMPDFQDPNQMKAIMNEIVEFKAKIISDFTKAYLAQTGLDIANIKLIEDFSQLPLHGRIVYYFEVKNNESKN